MENSKFVKIVGEDGSICFVNLEAISLVQVKNGLLTITGPGYTLELPGDVAQKTLLMLQERL